MKNVLGSWIGTTTPRENLIPVLQTKEEARVDRPKSLENGFSILQLGVVAPADTKIVVNGQTIQIPQAGVFQLSYGLIELESLVFLSAVSANIVYVY